MEVGSLHSTIDYAIMSHRMYDRLRVMNIDEHGARSLGSDHKRIKMSFGIKTNSGMKHDDQPDGIFYSEQQIETASTQIEAVISKDNKAEWTYTKLMGLFGLELAKVRVRKKRTRRKPKSWWDGEVKKAIEKRQEASREHRYSKHRGDPEADVERKWDKYIKCRREASYLINEKIRRQGSQCCQK